MIARAVSTFLLFALLSCVDHDLDNASPDIALSIAASFCEKDAGEMGWLKILLESGETDLAQRGDIYAILLDGNVIFVHQPLIMSCFACVLYDCEGNRITATVANHQKISESMDSATKIYSAY